MAAAYQLAKISARKRQAYQWHRHRHHRSSVSWQNISVMEMRMWRNNHRKIQSAKAARMVMKKTKRNGSNNSIAYHGVTWQHV